jgi:hypothetical protein
MSEGKNGTLQSHFEFECVFLTIVLILNLWQLMKVVSLTLMSNVHSSIKGKCWYLQNVIF